MFDILSSIWKYSSMPLFEVSGNKISVLSIFMAAAIFFATAALSKMVEKLVHKFFEDKEIDSGVKGSLARFSRYIVFTIGILITLDTVGISLSSLAAIGAVLMVGIGFGLQNIAQNFISGLIILLERPIKIGDLVEVKGVSGKVVEIGARSTLIHTRDDVAIIVPNSQFISEQVINESFSGSNVRLHLNVGVSYGSSASFVKEMLLDIAKDHTKVLSYPAPEVFLTEFGESSLDFKLLIWVNENWTHARIMSEIRFQIFEKFKENNIEIPFPQRVIHTA